MPPHPSFTIAIPTYNGAEHLREALLSAKSQEGIDLAFLLSDDRSDDDTVKIAREMLGDRIHVSVNSERLGLAGNWNQCARLSDTPFLAILHQDDVLLKNHLAKHLAAFHLDPNIGLCASASKVVDRAGKLVPENVVGTGGLGPEDRVFQPREVLPLMTGGNPFRCSAISLRRSAFETTEGFDPRLKYVVDWDFWIKIAKANAVAWLAEPTVLVRWHKESETHRFATDTIDLEESAKLIQELLDDLRTDPAALQTLRSRVNQTLARAYLNRAYVAAKASNSPLAKRAILESWRLDRQGLLRQLGKDPGLAFRVLFTIISSVRHHVFLLLISELAS